MSSHRGQPQPAGACVIAFRMLQAALRAEQQQSSSLGLLRPPALAALPAAPHEPTLHELCLPPLPASAGG